MLVGFRSRHAGGLRRRSGPMSESQPVVCYERQGDVALVTLNRPHRHNAINAALNHFLGAAIRRAEAEDVAVVVLTGAGEKAFCAGGDMLEMSGVEAGADALPPRAEQLDGYEVLSATPLPVIAAINGYCFGGGARLAVSCDIRLAAAHASFRLPGVEYGLVVTAAMLPRLVGTSKAKEWIYTARRFEAAEALAAGLLSAVHPAAELLPAALAMAGTIAAHSRAAVRESKRVIDAATLHEAAIDMENAANRVLRGSREQAERFRDATRKVTGR
jgi:crotonobetainyl-CoA hydratase